MLDKYLQDFVLEPWLDSQHEPPAHTCPATLPGTATPPRQTGTLIAGVPRPSPLHPHVIRRSRGMQTSDSPEANTEPCWLFALPLEVLGWILEEAALSSMVDERDGLVCQVTIDCLRPEAGVQQTMDVYPKLVERFNATCKKMAPVCRVFYHLVLPFLWKQPFFSQKAEHYDSFFALLPKTTAIKSIPTLPAPQPFATYVKTLTAFGSSLFHLQPNLLVQTLPLLTHLETLRFGSSSADMPLPILEQLALVTPPSIRRLPDILLHPKEKAGDASQRLSALFTLASRCERLEALDIIWGHALGGQLDHLLFMLQLQALQPEGWEAVSLRSLSFNEQCDVSLNFLEQLPRVAPGLSSLHFEIGSRIVDSRGNRAAVLNLPAVIAKLPYLESFSFTPHCEVIKVGSFDDILITHPRMKSLQIFISDFNICNFLRPLIESPTTSLRCLCLAATTDDLSTLLVLRRPWRLRKMAPLVLEYVEIMGCPMDEQMRLDLFRKADLVTLPKNNCRVNFD